MRKKRIERLFASSLAFSPGLYNLVRHWYLKLNFYIFQKNSVSKVRLHPLAHLMTPEQWACVTGAPIDPAERFFGYYDKSPWSQDGMCFLFHQMKLKSNELEIVMFQNNGVGSVVGRSVAWNYQQGTMLQWVSGGRERFVFNDIVGDRLVSRVIFWKDGREITIPFPIQTIHPNGDEALSLNYKRLYRLRPEYGYAPSVSNFSPGQHLNEDGIWRINLSSAESQMVVSLDMLVRMHPRAEMRTAKHWVNHIMYSPSGTKYVFLHRWSISNHTFSRLYVMDLQTGALTLLMDDDMASHYSWCDENHILVWGRTAEKGDHYYLVDVNTGDWEIIGEGKLDVYGDGHPSYSPDRRWIITDSYPDRKRQRHLLLYEVETHNVTKIASFLAPWRFDGPNRCDLHPRWSPNGKMLSVDSTHEGRRNTYILDISALVN